MVHAAVLLSLFPGYKKLKIQEGDFFLNLRGSVRATWELQLLNAKTHGICCCLL